MLQDFTTQKRFCSQCGADISTICPRCHGLGYMQPLPDMPSLIVPGCVHPNERGQYCSICGAKLGEQNISATCTTCGGKGWIPALHHYCVRSLGPPPRR